MDSVTIISSLCCSTTCCIVFVLILLAIIGMMMSKKKGRTEKMKVGEAIRVGASEVSQASQAFLRPTKSREQMMREAEEEDD